ncbi:hypothetical protein [Amycolatopsis sp. NPDC051372]|uniref:hypothetical protein n=1 Tax=unclassified Amycolatopsis TaxID=2618356 RepID=UPI00341898E2
MITTEEGAERARARGQAAGARARELATRRAALTGRGRAEPGRTAAARAAQRVQVAQERAATARESLRQGFLRAAAAHERAARVLERVAEHGIGDVLACRGHAARHRADAEADRRRAAECSALPTTGETTLSARRNVLRRHLAHTASQADPPVSRAVAAAAAHLVRDVDAVVITIRGRGLTQHELAATDPWGQRIEELQYITGEGPSITAFTTGQPVTVTRLSEHAGRWPGFVGAAGEYGVDAVFAFPLSTATALPLGTMTLYRRDTGTPPAGLADAHDLVELVATALSDDRELAQQISSSTAYEDINIAVGLLSIQQTISTDEALVRLRASAFASGRPLIEAARDVVARHSHRHRDQRRE